MTNLMHMHKNEATTKDVCGNVRCVAAAAPVVFADLMWVARKCNRLQQTYRCTVTTKRCTCSGMMLSNADAFTPLSNSKSEASPHR